MEPRQASLSTTLLLAVLGGKTYEVVARDHGLTRTAVERRVKTLVRRVLREQGVDGLNESRAVYVRNLRAHRAAIESALTRLDPAGPQVPLVGSRILSDADIELAMRRVRMNTGTPERDVAMVWILLATGLRPLEIARLMVGDFLCPDGRVKICSEVRAEVAANHRQRPLFFSSSSARTAIEAYLARRGTSAAEFRTRDSGSAYACRGLSSEDALFLNAAGQPFKVESMRTDLGTRSLCQEIHYAYRKIFRRIGFAGLSALNVRHTVIDRLARRGADEIQIGQLLGIQEFRPHKSLRPSLEQLMDELV